MQGSLKNPYKNFEMSHNFFGWGILEIFLKNPFFITFWGPKTYFWGSKVYMASDTLILGVVYVIQYLI